MIVQIKDQFFQLAGQPSPGEIHKRFEPRLEIPVFEELYDGLAADAYSSEGFIQARTIEAPAGVALRSIVCMESVIALQQGAYFGPAVKPGLETIIRAREGMRIFSLWSAVNRARFAVR